MSRLSPSSVDRRLAELAAGLEAPRLYGTAFPTSPYPGMSFYRTDLTAIFWYDNFRTCWLGELERETFGFSGSLAASAYMLTAGGLTGTTSIGPRIPYTARIVGYSYRVDTGQAGDFEVMASSTIKLTVSHTGAGTGSMAQDATLAVGDRLGVRNKSTATAVVNPIFTVYFRREAT